MHLLVSKPCRSDPKSNPQTTPVIRVGIQYHSPSKTQDPVAGWCDRLVTFWKRLGTLGCPNGPSGPSHWGDGGLLDAETTRLSKRWNPHGTMDWKPNHAVLHGFWCHETRTTLRSFWWASYERSYGPSRGGKDLCLLGSFESKGNQEVLIDGVIGDHRARQPWDLSDRCQSL